MVLNNGAAARDESLFFIPLDKSDVSLREPVPTQTPRAALSSPAIGSVMIVKPLERLDISNFIPPV